MPNIGRVLGREEDGTVEELLGQPLGDENRQELRWEVAKSFASPMTSMATMLEQQSPRDQAVWSRVDEAPASLQECIRETALASLEGKRVLFLVPNGQYMSKLLAMEMARQRLDTSVQISSLIHHFSEALQRATFIPCRDMSVVLSKLHQLQPYTASSKANEYNHIVIGPLGMLFSPFLTTKGLNTAGEGMLRQLELLRRRLHATASTRVNLFRQDTRSICIDS